MLFRAAVSFLSFGVALFAASEALDRAHKYEDTGDSARARETYTRALKQTPADAEMRHGYAEFLERYHDKNAVAEYRRASQ